VLPHCGPLFSNKSWGSMTILNIDDDNEDLMVFYDAVKTVNPLAKCFLAKNSQEAINLLQHSINPDFIFLDIHMPLMDGRAALKEIKKIKRLASVPVIIYSTVIYDNEKESFKEWGAYEFIKKQNSFAALCDELRKLGINQR
jgi:CheY-like chemotaxis protein